MAVILIFLFAVNDTGDEGVTALAAALRENTSLTTLDVESEHNRVCVCGCVCVCVCVCMSA
jgi:hypothetical protein